MQSKHFTIIGIVILSAIIWYGLWFIPRHMPVDSNQVLIEKIDSLQNKIDSISTQRDSIKTVIDTTRVQIKEIHKTYEKTVNTILVQPLDSDRSFFTNYISEYSRQLNTGHSDSAESD